MIYFQMFTNKHGGDEDGQTDLCSQVVSRGQVFEPKQAVPVACPTSAWIMLNNLKQRNTELIINLKPIQQKQKQLTAGYLDLPEGFAAGGRGSRLPSSSAKENVLLFSVVVACQEFLLLCMEQPYNITLEREITANNGKKCHFK